jgi:hypothetical protein
MMSLTSSLSCGNTKDCDALGFPGQVCCATVLGTSPRQYVGSSSCVVATACNLGEPFDQFCDPQDPSECYAEPNNGTCSPYSPTVYTPTAMFTCQPP